LALAAWLGVGLAAASTGQLAPPHAPNSGYAALSEEQIDSVTYDNLPGDAEFVSRLARPDHGSLSPAGLEEFAAKLRPWGPGAVADPGQRARNLLSVAAIADVSQDAHEGEIARLIFDELRAEFGDERLSRILAWIILYPQEGTAICSAPELGLARQYKEEVIRQRIDLYSRKFLGRLRGKISE
jgi:ABC-2 type transport system permease protein